MRRSYPDKQEVQIGDIVLYRLRREQEPVHPEKIWHGQIEMILVNIHDRSQRHYYLITSLEEEYKGQQDLVYPDQVVSIEYRTLL